MSFIYYINQYTIAPIKYLAFSGEYNKNLYSTYTLCILTSTLAITQCAIIYIKCQYSIYIAPIKCLAFSRGQITIVYITIVPMWYVYSHNRKFHRKNFHHRVFTVGIFASHNTVEPVYKCHIRTHKKIIIFGRR